MIMEQARNRDRGRIRPAASEFEAGQKIEKGPEPKPDEDQLRKADQRAAQQRAVQTLGRTGIQGQQAAQQQAVQALGQTAAKAAAQQP